MCDIDLIPAHDNLMRAPAKQPARDRPPLEQCASSEVILDQLELSVMPLGSNLLDPAHGESVDRPDPLADELLEP